MWFVTLLKFRRRPTKADLAEEDRLEKDFAKRGLKVHSDFYTLGRFDNVMVIEAPDAKTVMDFFLAQSNVVGTETLTAIPKEEARKLLQ
jgi:uncharacterized protein with GYD domain